jgi:hypothetical protein
LTIEAGHRRESDGPAAATTLDPGSEDGTGSLQHLVAG